MTISWRCFPRKKWLGQPGIFRASPVVCWDNQSSWGQHTGRISSLILFCDANHQHAVPHWDSRGPKWWEKTLSLKLTNAPLSDVAWTQKLFSVLALTSQFSVHIRNPDNKKNPPTQKYFPPTCTLFAVLPIVGSGILLASGGLTAYSKACRGKWNIFLELALEQTMIDAQPTQTLMHTYPHKSNGAVGMIWRWSFPAYLAYEGQCGLKQDFVEQIAEESQKLAARTLLLEVKYRWESCQGGEKSLKSM